MITISVVMPTYRDSVAALETAELLCPQLRTSDELLIVDNGSGPKHREVFEAFARQHPGVAIRILVCEARGSYAARNMGAAHARGDILAFTDAGCLPCAGWVDAIRSHFAEHQGSRVAGPIEMVFKHSPPALIELVDARAHLNQDRYVAQGWAATANTAMVREAFVALGGFDQRLQSGGDFEFGMRARAHGHSIDWCAAMVVRHESRYTLHELLKKRRRIRLGQRQIAGLAEFPEVRRRAMEANGEVREIGAPRAYPPMSAARWLLARLATRLLHTYERFCRVYERHAKTRT
nr:glycosyltransferase family 2 protein [Variovorax boronicumulans]